MDKQQLLDEYLKNSKVMQLATCNGSQPWVCNVRFVSDDQRNLYWLSVEDCRHSQEIGDNPMVAVAIAINKTPPLIGVQIQALAEQIEFSDEILSKYAAAHDAADFIEKVKSGKTPLKLYRAKPDLLSIFDQKNFAESPKQEWRL